MGRKAKDRVGQKYGRLVVVSRELAASTKNAYWLCKCDCGNYCTVIAVSLNSGDTKSCGCLRIEKVKSSEWRRRTGKSMTAEGNFSLLCKAYQNNAKQTGRNFSLSYELFKELVTSDCYYCGSAPSSLFKSRSRNSKAEPCIYNGIDRKDNSIGYVPSNCLPCCYVCNRAKQAMAFEDFLLWVDRLSQFQQRTQIEII